MCKKRCVVHLNRQGTSLSPFGTPLPALQQRRPYAPQNLTQELFHTNRNRRYVKPLQNNWHGGHPLYPSDLRGFTVHPLTLGASLPDSYSRRAPGCKRSPRWRAAERLFRGRVRRRARAAGVDPRGVREARCRGIGRRAGCGGRPQQPRAARNRFPKQPLTTPGLFGRAGDSKDSQGSPTPAARRAPSTRSRRPPR